ncbi:hypothetical protein MPSEU_000309600 [Mayamaea pseudoterrestris]|nr:hypothetical protein MPSEU_000309600 [Mayamaea pseudoterrestris]
MQLYRQPNLLLLTFALQFNLTLSFRSFVRRHPSPHFTLEKSTIILPSGRGVANDYTWHEEAFEIEVSVPVPINTRTKDLRFKATSKSIELTLLSQNNHTVLLLDPSRALRGRVNMDGTYWVIGDDCNKTHRTVTVTIEKLLQTPQDDFEIIDYDWKGVYVNDADEVSERIYDEPEPLDVRKYAASLGVDIDNINMSMVDKTMFSSNLNLTRSSLDELTKSGYAQEVTRQADGTEYVVNDDGAPERVASMQEEMGATTRPKIPLIDTDSPWNSAVPIHRNAATNQTYIQETRNFTQAAFAQDAALQRQEREKQLADATAVEAKDPIDTLTVAKLKEVLASQGLKTSGTKQELKERLRAQVNSLLQGKQ